jgi:hypothetical protein
MFHELKTDQVPFIAVAQGLKTFEIRKADRNFKPGDILSLRCTQHTGEEMKKGKPLVYLGEAVHRKITHVIAGPVYGLAEGWVIMSIKPMD